MTFVPIQGQSFTQSDQYLLVTCKSLSCADAQDDPVLLDADFLTSYKRTWQVSHSLIERVLVSDAFLSMSLNCVKRSSGFKSNPF